MYSVEGSGLEGFSVIQILREISLESLGSFTIFGTLNFANLVNYSLQKVQKIIEYKNSEPLNV